MACAVTRLWVICHNFQLTNGPLCIAKAVVVEVAPTVATAVVAGVVSAVALV